MPQKSRSTKSPEKGFQLRELPGEVDEATSDAAPAKSYEDLGELPRTYGEDVLFLVAQEPHRLFTYWDIDIAKHPGGPAFLRTCHASGDVAAETQVSFETRNWYLPVDHADAEYFVEIGYYRGGEWRSIARSAPVKTPPENLSPSESFDFATVPFHLSFQRLIDNLETARRSGDDLLAAVSRMQRDGNFTAFGASGLPSLLSDDQLLLLRTLLGQEFLEELASGGLSSQAIEASIRAFLAERLSSGGASDVFAEFQAAAAAGSLFSGMTLIPSSEMLASWGTEELASWAAGTLSSWIETTSWTQGILSSSMVGSSEMIASSWAGASSWTSGAAASSWPGAATSSWSMAALSSWTAETSASLASLSSWLQGVQSSWASAALSSWPAAASSSWFSAESLTSWSGASESLSSFPGERGFFMHVNAEVIFYGGTDPKARLTVGGEPVTLSADGTFRFHFVFPNADYEIPIIATSPDGLETRMATLRFHRDTQKIGEVTDTGQPPLGEPMGRSASAD